MRKNSRRFHPGVTLAEYAIALGLVAVAGAASLYMMGVNVSALLGKISQATGGSGGGASTVSLLAPVSGSAVGSLNTGGGGPSGSSGGSPNVSVSGGGMANGVLTLSSGLAIPLPNYPKDLQTSLQTSGANGTTNALASTMQTMFDALLADGQITPEQASRLKQLADKGHEIAGIEKQIENLVLTNHSDPSLVTLAESINYNAGEENGVVREFRDLYEQAVAGGVLKDPVAQKAVGILVDQIANVASGVENMSIAAREGVLDTNDMIQSIVEGMGERDTELGIQTVSITLADLQSAGGASGYTDVKSGEICSTGGGSDSGTACR